MSQLEQPPVQDLDAESVPVRALLISAAALAVPLVSAVFMPTWVDQDAGLLLWLTALVPAFLLTYYRGWPGASLALAAGMATLAVGQTVLGLTAARPPGWPVVLALVAAFVGICLGIGWVGELLHQARRDAQAAALTDTLTGLPNRRHLEIFLNATYASAERGGSLAVAVFDLDRFKAVNDRHGHAAGDQVLRAVGQALRTETRQSDVTVRFGGEEFVSVLPGGSEDAAMVFAERVRRSIGRLEFPWGRVTVSAGVAEYRPHLVSPDLLLAEADRALYAAKDGGRDRVARASALDGVDDADDAGDRAHEASPGSEGQGAASRRILLVETDPARRRSLARALERFGFRVAVAEDGRRALEELAGDDAIHVVLADVVMPGMGGLALAERVRAEHPGVRVLLMSGYEQASRAGGARPPGVSRFLRKPVSLSELATALETAVHERATSPRDVGAFGHL